jgi:hypothetical protein
MECGPNPSQGSRELSFIRAALRRGGKIAGMAVAFLDITERKRAQEPMLRKLSSP